MKKVGKGRRWKGKEESRGRGKEVNEEGGLREEVEGGKGKRKKRREEAKERGGKGKEVKGEGK